MATQAHARSVELSKLNGRTGEDPTRRKRRRRGATRRVRKIPAGTSLVSPRDFRSAREEPFGGFCFCRTRPTRSRSRPSRRFARYAARKRPAASNADATRSRARPTRRRGASGALSIFPRRREYTRARSVRSVPGTITRRRRSSSSRPSSRDSRRFPRSRGSPDAAEARVGALLLFCPHARASLPSREAIQKPKKKRAVDRSRRARRRFPAYAKDYSAE